MNHVLALDIGGTKMAGAIVDASGNVLAEDRIQTPRSDSADTLFAALEAMCRALVGETRIAAVGVGCGGPMRYPAGIVSPLNIPAWREFPLRERLQDSLQKPCLVDNDAKALALGERWKGAGHSSDNMLGMVVSTGVGGGIILDGRLLHGESGNAGHIGHIIVWPEGPLCGCGARGCVEGVASGTGLARRLSTERASWETTLQPGSTAQEIAVAARTGDPLAQYLYRTAGEGVGRGISGAAALLDLEVVVLGGSIALKAWDLLGPPLLGEVESAARLDFTRNVKVVHAELGDRAGLLGAAQVALSLL